MRPDPVTGQAIPATESQRPDRPLRIMLVASRYPSLITGQLRQVHLLRGLAARHHVRLVSLDLPRPTGEAPALDGVVETIVVPAGEHIGARARASRWVRRMRAIPDPDVAALAAVVDEAVRREAIDVLLVAGREIGPALERLPDAPLVLDLCDARSARLRGQLRVAAPWSRFALSIRYLAERRYERSLLRRSGRVLVASERDLAALDGDGAVPITVVPNGVDTETWRRTTDRLGEAVAFSGAMDYAPNADAAIHLARSIMPSVWTRRPETRLLIIGRDPGEAVLDLASDRRVTVTGTVADMRPHLEEAAVYAAPLRFAAGIQNKLLEAMAMAIPVVTTPVAAAGLQTPGGPPPPIAVAREPAELADDIVAMLERRDTDGTPDARAREFVETWFGWARAVSLLEEVLAAAVGQEPT